MADTPLKLRSWLSPGIRNEVFVGLVRHISECIGREISLDFCDKASGPTALRNPFETGEVDLGWMCSTAFIELSSVTLIEAAWIPNEEAALGEPQYFSDLFCPGKEIQSVTDLKGLSLGCNDPLSLSGYHALRITLEKLGHRLEDFVEVVFTGGHLDSIRALELKSVDAIVVDSITAIVERPHYKPNLRLGPWPTQPLVASQTLEPSIQNAILDALLCAEENPKLKATLNSCGIQRFGRITAAAYAPLVTYATHQLPEKRSSEAIQKDMKRVEKTL